MKTVAAIKERAEGTPVCRLATMLTEQILEIMPELRDVTPWHNVGQRRSLDDVGPDIRHPIREGLGEVRRGEPAVPADRDARGAAPDGEGGTDAPGGVDVEVVRDDAPDVVSLEDGDERPRPHDGGILPEGC